MDKSKEEYQICQAAFAVPDIDTAKRIFQEALGLKLFTKTGLAYWVNSVAVLFCSIKEKSIPTSDSHTLYLYTSGEKMKSIAKKLEKSSEVVQLSEKELLDGRVNLTLQIRTTIGSLIVLTSRGHK
jgi:hypothetical protein